MKYVVITSICLSLLILGTHARAQQQTKANPESNISSPQTTKAKPAASKTKGKGTYLLNQECTSELLPVLDKKDLATAGGNTYVGLHNDFIYGIMHEKSWWAETIPDEWSNDGEIRKWGNWYSAFSKLLYDKWKECTKLSGQETVQIAIMPDKKVEIRYKGNVFPGTRVRTLYGKAIALDKSVQSVNKFKDDVEQTIRFAVDAAPPLPQTKNPLKEFRSSITFGADREQFPRYSPLEFHTFARLNASNDNIVVFMENQNPMAGVQCMNDKNGGSIIGVDKNEFQNFYKKIQEGEEPDN